MFCKCCRSWPRVRWACRGGQGRYLPPSGHSARWAKHSRHMQGSLLSKQHGPAFFLHLVHEYKKPGLRTLHSVHRFLFFLLFSGMVSTLGLALW